MGEGVVDVDGGAGGMFESGSLEVLNSQHHVADILVRDTAEVKEFECLNLAAFEQGPETLEANLLSAHRRRLVRSKGDRCKILPTSHHATEDSVRDGMLAPEALDVRAGSSDGRDDLGSDKATILIGVIEEVLKVATIADDTKDQLCHLEVQEVILDLKTLDRFLALLHQDDKCSGEVLMEGEAEFAVLFAPAREGERGDVGVKRVHAGLLREMMHDGRVLDRDGRLGDEGRVAVGDTEGPDPGGEAAELLETGDEGVEFHVVEGDMGIERRVGEDAVPCATSAK